MATTKKVEGIEAQAAMEKVVEADNKVEQIKAEKAAKKAKKHEERLQKHPKLGKFVNWCDDNKTGVLVGALIGGPIGVAVVKVLDSKKKAKTDSSVDISTEVEESPFDTEA